MPVVHHETKNGMYTEMRYNYESVKTASLYAGKSFNKKGTFKYTLTPMLGLVFGNYNGGSLAMNIEMEYKKTFISMQTQYTVNSDDVKENFFFNWSEIAYQPLKWFYAGVSMQQTRLHSCRFQSEYGVLAGFVVRKFTIPVYAFNPLTKNKNFIVGIKTEW